MSADSEMLTSLSVAELEALADGLLARHIRRMRREYAARHDRILQTLLTDFAKWLVPVPSVTGMHLAATLRSRSVRRSGL